MSKYTRKEMREELEIRGYSERTISIYTHHMISLAEYFNKAPHTLTAEHIHAYQVYLVQEKQVSWTSFNQAVCAMRFFLSMWLKMTG
jgi:integrase/recombinase XerD